MFLTITTTHRPATDLGYLLHKNPNKVQEFALSFGKALVFYPEAAEDCCTAALLLEIDPVRLVRKGRLSPAESANVFEYVNDRPYVASSFLSVAIAQVFGTAMSGRSKDREELAKTPIPLQAKIPVLPCRGGIEVLQRLFGPLGYELQAESISLDSAFPQWGSSRYYSLSISGTVTLQSLLQHLYVLIPVLDDEKHYWVGHDELEKLLRSASEWLPKHPEKELIARRYLRHRMRLVREVLARIIDEDQTDPDVVNEENLAEESKLEEPITLNEQRIGSVLAAIRSTGAKSVVDLGCGSAKLLSHILREKSINRIVGMDVSWHSLEVAREILRYDQLPEMQRSRIELMHGSLLYRDERLSGFECATAVEVIEHLDPARLAAFERVIFEFARPNNVIITTPNVEYNVKFENLPNRKFRHKDHRFEWTRAEFEKWSNSVAERFNYSVRFVPIGNVDSVVGSPTQMGIFEAKR